jgi:8-oxo-dGTP diphosphatase
MELKKDRFYITTDSVVFTIINDDLNILLVKRKYAPFKGKYALPGGFVRLSEDIEASALRELKEETGVKNIFMKQLNSYGKVGRDPRARIITVPFFALINSDKVKLQGGTDAESAHWFPISELPELGFDHKKIIADALDYLKSELQKTNVAVQIMPEKFTLTELQKMYEAVLDTELDKRNFRKKIKELDLLKSLNETKMDGPHRPAQLFKFKDKNYFRFE